MDKSGRICKVFVEKRINVLFEGRGGGMGAWVPSVVVAVADAVAVALLFTMSVLNPPIGGLAITNANTCNQQQKTRKGKQEK